MRCACLAVLLVCLIELPVPAQQQTPIPDDFPRFLVPGQEKALQSLRALCWRHYPTADPKSTLWDEWLPGPALWPAVATNNAMDTMRARWRDVLSRRILDAEGYVASHQHASFAHPLGWPFPFWKQGEGSWGWHFSFKNTPAPTWLIKDQCTQQGWGVDGARDAGLGEWGWNLDLTAPNASVTTPDREIDTLQSPFLQLRWRATGLGNAQPYLEWTTKENPQFGPARRFYFDPVESADMVYQAIPIYKHPRWTGTIDRLRLGFGNPAAGEHVTLQALFTQYDTRQNVNNASFIDGCAAYFLWTGDLTFLRRNLNRMRQALRYVMTELHAQEKSYVLTLWVGHDGRSGLARGPDGAKKLLYGHGVGSNYWDLLPFGYADAYATIRYYAALQTMIALERTVRAHPEWDMPGGALALDPDDLVRHAAAVKVTGNRLFWNPATGRFAPGVDADSKMHDYGLTSLNTEAIYYGFATDAHARSILDWLSGKRIVAGDTSQGADIYHWRFAPRATTKRNIEYYGWFWFQPEAGPFGNQVQDGGAVLGFSYHDLMARLKVNGPNDAWQRLQEIAVWLDEVDAAGGYRAYYNGSREGTLQGGGTAGGLGLDQEFFESVLVPQVLLDGFLGFAPLADGFRLDPRLPDGWPELTIDRIHYHNLILRITAQRDHITIGKEGEAQEPLFVRLPEGRWQAVYLAQDGTVLSSEPLTRRPDDGAAALHWAGVAGVRLERIR